MPLDEVGLVPGSYRILDLFCLREVLNQIMKVGVVPKCTTTFNKALSSVHVGLMQDSLCIKIWMKTQ